MSDVVLPTAIMFPALPPAAPPATVGETTNDSFERHLQRNGSSTDNGPRANDPPQRDESNVSKPDKNSYNDAHAPTDPPKPSANTETKPKPGTSPTEAKGDKPAADKEQPAHEHSEEHNEEGAEIAAAQAVVQEVVKSIAPKQEEKPKHAKSEGKSDQAKLEATAKARKEQANSSATTTPTKVGVENAVGEEAAGGTSVPDETAGKGAEGEQKSKAATVQAKVQAVEKSLTPNVPKTESEAAGKKGNLGANGADETKPTGDSREESKEGTRVARKSRENKMVESNSNSDGRPATDGAAAVANTPVAEKTTPDETASRPESSLANGEIKGVSHAEVKNSAPATDQPTNAPHRPAGASGAEADSGGTNNVAAGVDRVRFVQRVARAFQAAQEQGGQVRLRLNPPELGAVKVEVNIRDGVMSAHLETETASARSLLLENLPALRDRLAEQNVRVERFDVDIRERQPGSGPFDTLPNQSQADDGAQQRGNRRNRLRAGEESRVAAAGGVKPNLAGNSQLNVVI